MFTERIGAVELISRPEGRVALAGTLLAFLQVGFLLTSTNTNTNTSTNTNTNTNTDTSTNTSTNTNTNTNPKAAVVHTLPSCRYVRKMKLSCLI